MSVRPIWQPIGCNWSGAVSWLVVVVVDRHLWYRRLRIWILTYWRRWTLCSVSKIEKNSSTSCLVLCMLSLASCLQLLLACWMHIIVQFLLGRLPNFGSRPNTMGGKFPYVRVSVRPQKVSSILMKFGVHVVLDERWKKVMTMPGSKVKVRSPRKSEIRPFWTIFKLSFPPFLMGADKWPRILKLGGNV